MNRANQVVSNFRGHLEQQYGFVADASKPLWQNIESTMGNMTTQQYSSRPRKMACHNYLVYNDLPQGTANLLGLGLNYCVTTKEINTTKNTFERFRQDIRRKWHFTIKPPTPKENQYGPDYIPGLYIKSDYPFPSASDDIEEAIDNFQAAFEAAQKQNSKRHKFKPNLTHAQWTLMRFLRKHNKYIVVEADKNLGPCIMDRSVYIRRGCIEHLGDERNYKIITKQQADAMMRGIHYSFHNWTNRYYSMDQHNARERNEIFDGPVGISDTEHTYLSHAFDLNQNKLAKFRQTVKAHKTKPTWRTFTGTPVIHKRPIVCCAGTFMNNWSQWLDYQL